MSSPTGRLKCSGPNIQSVSRRDDTLKPLRDHLASKVFVGTEYRDGEARVLTFTTEEACGHRTQD